MHDADSSAQIIVPSPTSLISSDCMYRSIFSLELTYFLRPEVPAGAVEVVQSVLETVKAEKNQPVPSDWRFMKQGTCGMLFVACITDVTLFWCALIQIARHAALCLLQRSALALLLLYRRPC